MQPMRFIMILLVCHLSNATWAQVQSNVKGLVTDSSGEPLIGVSILVKSTNNGTVSDLDGKFTVTAKTGDILHISYVGYISQEIKAEENKQLRIIMEEDTKKLEEVVIVGYGTQKKVNLTGSVSSISAEDLASKPVMSTAQALAGLAPGLSVLQTSGRPGTGATVKIRGTGTFSNAGTDPLVLIDGLSGNIDDIDPNDIQSISFLKDAASASIYGNRAANGVILVETKKGVQGKTTITYSNSFGWQRPTELPDFLPSWEYAEYYNMAMRNMDKQDAYLPEEIQKFKDGSDPDNYPNVNHLKWLLESGSGFQHQHNVSIQGGNATTNYNLSIGYRNQEGMTANTSNERMTALFTMKSEIAKGLTLNLNINAYNNKYNAPNGEPQSIDGMIGYAVRQGPIYAGQKSDGSFGYQDNYSPEAWLASESFVQNINRNISASGQLKWDTPVEGLSFIGKAGVNYWTKYDKAYRADTYFDESKTVGPASLNVWTANNTYTTFEALATYEKRIKDHSFKLLAGTSVEQSANRGLEGYRNTFPNNYLYELGSGDKATATNNSSLEEYALLSFFGRINLDWENKYLLEVNLRADQSSRFLSNNRTGYFPSASVAWRMDQEAFMEDWVEKGLSNLKFRLSYGSLGNNSVGNYDAIATYANKPSSGSAFNYTLNNALILGLAQARLANPALTWESTYMTNVGFDFGLVNNKLTGTVDYFNKKTKDILINLPAPDVHGTASIPKQNSATVTNQGIEMTLGWQDQIGDFSYGVNGNFTFVKNKVNKFKGTDKGGISYDGANIIWEGHSINSQYLLRADRIIQTDADLALVQQMIDNAPIDEKTGKKVNPFAAFGTPQKGDLLYKDINGDGIIDMDDREIVSDGPNPKFQFGLNLNAAYKGFDFSVLFQGQAGVKVYWQNALANTSTVRFGYQLNKDVAEGRWVEGRTDAIYPRLLQSQNQINTQMSDFYLENKAFLKIRNIQLGYSLPKSITKKMQLERLRFYGSLENFFTFTSYRGFDPEISGLAYPAMKSAVLGINVTF